MLPSIISLQLTFSVSSSQLFYGSNYSNNNNWVSLYFFRQRQRRNLSISLSIYRLDCIYDKAIADTKNESEMCG